MYICMALYVAITKETVLLGGDLEIPNGDDHVQCYSGTDNCDGSSRITTRAACCDNRGKDPADFGFSVLIIGEGCSRCPIS